MCVHQSCPTFCKPMDCNLPGFSAHGILQARILEWVAISSSMGSSRPRDQTHASCINRQTDCLPLSHRRSTGEGLLSDAVASYCPRPTCCTLRRPQAKSAERLGRTSQVLSQPAHGPPGPSLEVNQYLISCLSSCCWGDASLPTPLSLSRDDLVQDEAMLSQGVGICRAEGI